MTMSQNQIFSATTDEYLETIGKSKLTPAEIEQKLLDLTNGHLALENVGRENNNKLPLLRTLAPVQISTILIKLHNAIIIAPKGNCHDDAAITAIYNEDGANKGVYSTSQNELSRTIRQYNMSIDDVGIKNVFLALRDLAPKKHLCENRDLIAVNNGIFDYANKQLLPFDPDKVFLSKSAVDYIPDAESPTITNPDGSIFEVEEWLASLSDDPEIVNLLWEVLGAIIRPNVRWNKSIWLFSESGNNGKGTLCSLMRNLCGGAHTSLPLCEMSNEFSLEPLLHSSAIIVDENDVGQFIDKAANLKAIQTGDVILVNRKYKQPIAFQFHGFMVQCLNELPRVRDKSASFLRRQLFVPFEKNFTGKENKAIKEDYLQRPEVLEYVLSRVLNMSYYILSTPEATKHALREFELANNPILEFWDELADEFAWDFLPNDFLYDLYVAWHKKTSPDGKIEKKITFSKMLKNAISPPWRPVENAVVPRPEEVSKPEPLLREYGLQKWGNPLFHGNDDAAVMAPSTIFKRGRGLRRVAATDAP